MRIIPAIIGQDFLEIEGRLAQVEGLVDWVQIDLVDGRFAEPPSWPYTQENVDDEIKLFHDLKTSLNIELHLMVADPEDTLDEWIDTPAKRIFVHPEATTHAELDLTVLDMTKIESGVCLKLGTAIDIVETYIDRVDDVQLMSIAKIGNYGAHFEEEVLEKIRELRERFPKITINVDGGINESNIKLVKDAGCDNAVVGSAIFGGKNIPEAIKRLQGLVS